MTSRRDAAARRRATTRSPTAFICSNSGARTTSRCREFTAGAHIAIHVPNGLLRKYSLCNDPAEHDRYLVAVKRETNGRGGSAT